MPSEHNQVLIGYRNNFTNIEALQYGTQIQFYVSGTFTMHFTVEIAQINPVWIWPHPFYPMLTHSTVDRVQTVLHYINGACFVNFANYYITPTHLLKMFIHLMSLLNGRGLQDFHHYLDLSSRKSSSPKK